jgi:hypothetical protein
MEQSQFLSDLTLEQQLTFHLGKLKELYGDNAFIWNKFEEVHNQINKRFAEILDLEIDVYHMIHKDFNPHKLSVLISSIQGLSMFVAKKDDIHRRIVGLGIAHSSPIILQFQNSKIPFLYTQPGFMANSTFASEYVRMNQERPKFLAFKDVYDVIRQKMLLSLRERFNYWIAFWKNMIPRYEQHLKDIVEQNRVDEEFCAKYEFDYS